MKSETVAAPRASVIIPVYNEAHRIQQSLDQLTEYFRGKDAEIIVVDDGSSDATASIAAMFEASPFNLRVVSKPHRGKAAAVLAGLEEAQSEIVGFMDADLATPLPTWERCLEALDDGAGVAIASREGIGSERVDEPWYRHAMGRIFNRLVQLLLLPGIHDTQCGFKVFTRAALDDILPRQQLYRDAAELRSARVTAFDVELLYIAKKHHHEIAIIPITWQYGTHSKVNPVTDTIQNGLDVLRVKWNSMRGRYD